VSYTQDFFTSRNSQTPGQEKVGQEGRLWYDSETNSIRVGDGKTTGGLFVGTGSPYSLPVASATTLGGVKIDGTTIVVNPETGEISSITGDAYRLPTASSVTLGGIKVGDNLTITPDGTLNAVLYQLPIASTSTLGGVKVDGSTVFVNDQGVISSTVYTLPTASNTILGGIRIGSGLTINSEGRVSAEQYQLPVANAYTLGGVKVDNSTIKIDDSGYISYTLPVANKLRLGAVKIGSGLTVDDTGLISTDNSWVMSVNSGTGIVVSQRTGDVTISTRIASTSVLGSVRVDNSTIVADPTGRISVTTSGIVGTVKSVSVNSANGFTGEVTSASTYPSITLGTSVDGLIKGVNGVIVNAQPSVDYQLPISLTTNGTTDSSTFINNVLNIPIYQGRITLQTAGISGKATLVDNILNIPDYGSVTSITFSSQDIAFSGTNPITRSGTVIMSLNTVPVSKGGTGRTSFTAGYLKSDGTVLSSSTNISAADVVGNISGKATNVTGVVSIENGGTGATTPKDAMIALLPSQTGNENKILSTDGGGILFWADRTETQYVSSVAVSGGTTGLTTSGGPITSRGTITLNGVLKVANGGTGASLPTDARANLEAAKSGANSDITSLSGLTTPLTIEQGGTNAKTAVEARVQLGAASRGANSDITSLSGLTTPLSVVQGGTGGANPTVARANLSAAKSGANSDITSLSGLTTPLSIDQGGTGASTAAGAINLLLPTQQGNEKKYLTTDGVTARWASVRPAAVGLDGQLQFNNAGFLNGTDRIFYDGRGELNIGSGSSEAFRFVGATAKDRYNSGTSVEIKGGDSYDLFSGGNIPNAGNVLLTGGRGLGDGDPGYISFRVGDESGEAFRINSNGSWSFGGNVAERGKKNQVLVAADERSQNPTPTWTYLPQASTTQSGLIKILADYSDGTEQIKSGLKLIQNPRPTQNNFLPVNAPDLVLRAAITDVDDKTLKLDSRGRIQADTAYIATKVLPALPQENTKKYLYTDGSVVYWNDLDPGLDLADNDNFGVVKIDGLTLKQNSDKVLYADVKAILPTVSSTEKNILFAQLNFNGTSNIYWDTISAGLPVATVNQPGLVKPDGNTLRFLSDGSISVNPVGVFPATSSLTYGKFLTNKLVNETVQFSWADFSSIIATTTTLGAVKVDGTTIDVLEDGTISADIVNMLPVVYDDDNDYFLAVNKNSIGGNGLYWSRTTYSLPRATTSILGGIIIDDEIMSTDSTGKLAINAINLSGSQGGIVYKNNDKTDVLDCLRYEFSPRTQTVGIGQSKQKITSLDSYPKLLFGEIDKTQSQNVIFETVRGADLLIKSSDAASTNYKTGNITLQGGDTDVYSGSAGGTVTLSGGIGDAGYVGTVPGGDIDIRGGRGDSYTYSTGNNVNVTNVARGGSIKFSTGITGLVERFRITDYGAWSLGIPPNPSSTDPTAATEHGQPGQPLLSRGWENTPMWGTVPLEFGGTGATVREQAINNLLPSQDNIANFVLITDGFNATWSPLYADGLLPVATTTTFGGIKIDNDTVGLDGSGVLSVITGGKVGTVSSVDVDGGTTGLIFEGDSITQSGVFTLSGTLKIENGGTGETNKFDALRALLPAQGQATYGRSLVSDGSNAKWDYPPAIVTSGRNGALLFNNNGLSGATEKIIYTSDDLILGVKKQVTEEDRNVFGIIGADGDLLNEDDPCELLIRPGKQIKNESASASLYLSGGSASGFLTPGGDIYIDGGVSEFGPGGNLVFRTSFQPGDPLAERLVIDNSGSWAVAGSFGQENQVLTSLGQNKSPIWRYPTVNAGGLTGTELAKSIVTSSLTSVGTLDSLTVNGQVTFYDDLDTRGSILMPTETSKLGIGTSDPKSKLSVSLGNQSTGIELNPADTTSTISSINRLNDTYTDLAIVAKSLDIKTGENTTTSRLLIQSNGAWAVSGDTGQQGMVLTSNGENDTPTWKSQSPDYEELTATTDQTVFDTTVNTVPNSLGKSRLQVFVNGVLQREGDTKAYLVTGPNQITFNQGLQADDELSIYSFV